MPTIEIVVLSILVCVVILFAIFMKKFLILFVNSVIGFFALFAVSLMLDTLVINTWSVLITAVGGIFGLIIVLILHLTGAAF